MRRLLLVAVFAWGCDNNSSGTEPDAPPTECEDVDQDGSTTCDGDCDDTTALTLPGADELCGDNEDNNCNGDIDEDCGAGVGTFVSAMTGDDANPGTADAPVATIAKGIENAMLLGGERSVVVGEGSYSEKVTLVDGIDLLGGHQCNTGACDWARDLAMFPSAIVNPDAEGVVAGPGITQATLLSGFTVTGLGGPMTSPQGSAAVTIAGGSPTLRGNRINGAGVGTGNDAGNRSIALAIRGTTGADGALIENNEIVAGTGNQSIAIAIESTSAATTSKVTIANNVIRSAAGRRSIGVLALRAAPGSTLTGNDITAGSSSGGASVGVHVGSAIDVDRNRINLDRQLTGTCMQATTWCAGISVEGATATITNNISLAPRGQRTAGLVLGELELPAGTVTVANNFFDGGGSGPNGIGGARNESAAIVLVRSSCSTCGLTGTVGRIANNILSAGANIDRYGVREDPANGRTIHPELVDANLFFFPPLPGSFRDDTYYRMVGSSGIPTDYKALFLFEQQTTVPAAKNDDGDPQLDASWHISPFSPCIDNGTTVDAPATDFEGDARPAGKTVDIGHDER